MRLLPWGLAGHPVTECVLSVPWFVASGLRASGTNASSRGSSSNSRGSSSKEQLEKGGNQYLYADRTPVLSTLDVFCNSTWMIVVHGKCRPSSPTVPKRRPVGHVHVHGCASAQLDSACSRCALCHVHVGSSLHASMCTPAPKRLQPMLRTAYQLAVPMWHSARRKKATACMGTSPS